MEEENENEESEFGKGFVYCLALFIAHQFKWHQTDVNNRNPSLWFYGAGDHLLEFMPEYAPTEDLKRRSIFLQEKVLYWRFNGAMKEDVEWALQESKDIIRETDFFYGVPVMKGRWE